VRIIKELMEIWPNEVCDRFNKENGILAIFMTVSTNLRIRAVVVQLIPHARCNQAAKIQPSI